LFEKWPTKYLAFLMARLHINVLMKEVSCTWANPRYDAREATDSLKIAAGGMSKWATRISSIYKTPEI
jgi:hypothetical protein